MASEFHSFDPIDGTRNRIICHEKDHEGQQNPEAQTGYPSLC